MPLRSVSLRVLATLTLAGASLAVALPASAHAELVSSDPADGATVDTLDTVRLEFSEELIEVGNSIVVTDGAGVEHELDVALAEPTVIEADVPEIAAGDITIAWRNASVDGHTEEGELHVTLNEPAPSPSVTPSASASPEPSASPSAVLVIDESASPSPSATPVESTGVSPWLWGILGLVVIGGAAAAIIAATRRPPLNED